MTEYEIFRLNKDFSYDELKKAFRKKACQLHPDKNNNSLKSHLAMIRVNQAYSTLLRLLENKPQQQETADTDDAYSFYKKGITKFQNIHPSKWKTYSKEGLFNPAAVKTHEQAFQVIEHLIRQMAEAYHDFSIVANEYEASEWHADSINKMKEIEKMTLRYARIRESYKAEISE